LDLPLSVIGIYK